MKRSFYAIRNKIINALRNQHLNVTQLANAIEASRPTVKRHLVYLMAIGRVMTYVATIRFLNKSEYELRKLTLYRLASHIEGKRIRESQQGRIEKPCVID